MANQSLKETPKTQSNPQHQVQGHNQPPKQKQVKLIIKRQDNRETKHNEESCEHPTQQNSHVNESIMELKRNTVQSKGETK
ncbi:succinate dehydrogenase iron-sulfur subunit, partial [Staphylococcus aureus]